MDPENVNVVPLDPDAVLHPAPAEVLEAGLAAYNQTTLRLIPIHDVAAGAVKAHQFAVAAATSAGYYRGLQNANNSALGHFAGTYATTGRTATAEVVDDILAGIAAKSETLFRQAKDAIATGITGGIPEYNAVLADLLAVVAAARAALQLTPSPTAGDIIAQMKAEDTTSTGADQMRLHLVSEHCYVNALDAPDRLVNLAHQHQYPACTAVTEWDGYRAAEVIADIPADKGRDRILDILNTVIERCEAALVKA